MLANNKISAVEPDFAEMCPKLTSLILTNNRLSKLEDVDRLGSGCLTLTRLSLIGNLVCNLPNYRLYTIGRIPSLKVLDFQSVTQQEREMARKLFTTEQPMATEGIAVAEDQQTGTKSKAVHQDDDAAAEDTEVMAAANMAAV